MEFFGGRSLQEGSWRNWGGCEKDRLCLREQSRGHDLVKVLESSSIKLMIFSEQNIKHVDDELPLSLKAIPKTMQIDQAHENPDLSPIFFFPSTKSWIRPWYIDENILAGKR